jgi:hypothetical protein
MESSNSNSSLREANHDGQRVARASSIYNNSSSQKSLNAAVKSNDKKSDEETPRTKKLVKSLEIALFLQKCGIEKNKSKIYTQKLLEIHQLGTVDLLLADHSSGVLHEKVDVVMEKRDARVFLDNLATLAPTLGDIYRYSYFLYHLILLLFYLHMYVSVVIR